MEYEPWKHLKKNNDIISTLIMGYIFEDGSKFLMEMGFYTQLEGFKNHYPDKFEIIINKINEIIKNKRKVFFTADYENPFILLDEYIYLEIFDITDPLKIFVEDKSRGSDYGD